VSELENQKAVSEAAAPIEEAAPTPEIDEVGLNPEEAAPVVEEEAVLIIRRDTKALEIAAKILADDYYSKNVKKGDTGWWLNYLRQKVGEGTE